MGLGLAIAHRISNILGHEISVRSRPGKGTVFSLQVPIGSPGEIHSVHQPVPLEAGRRPGLAIGGMLILCIDNDNNVLNAMRTVLEGWGCIVVGARLREGVLQQFTGRYALPDVMLVDYHLDRGETGVEVMNALQKFFKSPVPGVLITADMSEAVSAEAEASTYRELRKPINPGAVRNLLFKINQRAQHERKDFSRKN